MSLMHDLWIKPSTRNHSQAGKAGSLSDLLIFPWDSYFFLYQLPKKYPKIKLKYHRSSNIESYLIFIVNTSSQIFLEI